MSKYRKYFNLENTCLSLVVLATLTILYVYAYANQHNKYLANFARVHHGEVLNSPLKAGEFLEIYWDAIPKKPICSEIQKVVLVNSNEEYVDTSYAYFVAPERMTLIQKLIGKPKERYRHDVNDYRSVAFNSTGLLVPKLPAGKYGIIYRYEFYKCSDIRLELAHEWGFSPNVVEPLDIVWFEVF